MSRTIEKWRVKCTTTGNLESAWILAEDGPLSYCPDNSAHTIDANTAVVIDSISDESVLIKEETPPNNQTPTQGTYKSKGFNVSVQANTDAEIIITFPYQITLMNGWFHSSESHIGDKIDLRVAPDQIVGGALAPITTTTTTFPVSPTVTQYVFRGYKVNTLHLGNYTSHSLGEVLEVDSVNGTITVSQSPSANIEVADLPSTVIRMNAYVVEDLKISAGCQRYGFAEKKMGGKYVPANTVIKVDYHNLNGSAKDFDFNLEFLY